MQSIASKCRVGLRVARLSLCVSTENDGGFSPGYVLLSFQILTPSSRQPLLTTPLELRSRLPCVQTRENPPYKGGCPKIGLDRRRGMNQNTPNPGLALRWPHPCSLPIEWGSRGCPPNVNLRPRVVLDTQVWLPARDGDGKCCLLAKALWLTTDGGAWQRLWRGQRDYNRLRAYQVGETRGNRLISLLHVLGLTCGSGDPLATEVDLWIKLIPFIITL